MGFFKSVSPPVRNGWISIHFTEHGVQIEEGGLKTRCAIPLPVVSQKQLKEEKRDEAAEPVSPGDNAAFVPCDVHNRFG